jgi:SprT protein
MIAELLEKWKPCFSTLPAPYSTLDTARVTVAWNPRMRSRAGLCRPWNNSIELNPHLLKKTGDAERVLVHELCHLAVSRRWPHAQAHGSKWKKLMLHCGFEPERCHSLTPVRRHSQRRWKLNCNCKTHTVSTVVYNRIRRGTKYRCLDCRGFIQTEEMKKKSAVKPWARGFFSRIFS